MIALVVIVLLIAAVSYAYEEHYLNKKHSDKAKRMQNRIIEARKGYKNLGPSKPTDRPY